jgi:molecular chaperone GrpE (heat shock protein)
MSLEKEIRRELGINRQDENIEELYESVRSLAARVQRIEDILANRTELSERERQEIKSDILMGRLKFGIKKGRF